MTEEMNNFAPEVDAEVLSTQKKRMRRAFSRAGWAVLVEFRVCREKCING